MKMVRQMLFETLQDLSSEDFETFQWYLTIKILDGSRPIPKSQLENKTRIKTVEKMTESYTEETSVKLALEILRKMNMNEAAQKLKNKFTALPQSSSSSSSSSSSAPAPPPAAAMISAQQGSVVISPNISGSTTETLNITINKA